MITFGSGTASTWLPPIYSPFQLSKVHSRAYSDDSSYSEPVLTNGYVRVGNRQHVVVGHALPLAELEPPRARLVQHGSLERHLRVCVCAHPFTY
jgi:hypothetical protein